MLRITQSGMVVIDGRWIGDLYDCVYEGKDAWVFQHNHHGGATYHATNRDDVIAWLLEIIDDGLIAL